MIVVAVVVVVVVVVAVAVVVVAEVVCVLLEEEDDVPFVVFDEVVVITPVEHPTMPRQTQDASNTLIIRFVNFIINPFLLGKFWLFLSKVYHIFLMITREAGCFSFCILLNFTKNRGDC